MKRFLVTILAILYLGTSTGATLHLHYCMGKLVSMKLWHSDDGKCGNCGMKKNKACAKKCCKDEHKLIKLDKDHKKATENALQPNQVVAAAPAAYFEFPKVYTPPTAEEHPINHSPPQSNRLHILYCTFRI